MIRGVGPVYAKKLVRTFGEKIFDIIETSPDRLREVDSIGPVRAASILRLGGTAAIQVMTDNPYRLARHIRGIGFETADAIAMKLGIEKTAVVRVRAGISYALTEAMNEGHYWLPTDELTPLARAILGAIIVSGLSVSLAGCNDDLANAINKKFPSFSAEKEEGQAVNSALEVLSHASNSNIIASITASTITTAIKQAAAKQGIPLNVANLDVQKQFVWLTVAVDRKKLGHS